MPIRTWISGLFFHIFSPRIQLPLRKEPPSQQSDKDTLQDREEERGVSSHIILHQPHSHLEEAPCGIQVILPSLEYSWLGCGSHGNSHIGSVFFCCILFNFSLCLVYSEFIDLKCKIILGIVLSRAGTNSLCLWFPMHSLLELIVSMEQLNKLKRGWINVWILLVKGSVLDAPNLHQDEGAVPNSFIPNYLDGWNIQKYFGSAWREEALQVL